MKTLTHPTSEEYSPFYQDYISRAQSVNVFEKLPSQIDELYKALGTLTDKQALFQNASNEWSIKEIIGHLNDVERVFSYRLLRVSRGDKTPLPGFEQNDYVSSAGFDQYPLADLLAEFEHLRKANILAIQNMRAEQADERGTASGNPISARGLIYMLVGHVEHHMASLQEKYLPGIQ
jgi:uncharacterized damage-inducible protein DinB